jgi:hypothetical protein
VEQELGDIDPVTLLSTIIDDEDAQAAEHEPVGVTVSKLTKLAKRHKSLTSLVHLQCIKSYLELCEKYKAKPNIKNPSGRASHAVARSIGKGPYFAKKIVRLKCYIEKFQTLPPTSSGQHHAHPSLLNNERIHQAVTRYLRVQANGEVSESDFRSKEWEFAN